MFLAVTNCPPYFRRVGFRPPAIQLRKIDATVDEHLHAACSTRLPRPPRRVDPDIYSLHKVLAQEHVVVTKEDHMAAGIRPANEVYPFLK